MAALYNGAPSFVVCALSSSSSFFVWALYLRFDALIVLPLLVMRGVGRSWRWRGWSRLKEGCVLDGIVVTAVLVVGIGLLFWFLCWLLFGVGSYRVGEEEDERMVAIEECVSDGVVVALLWWC